MNLGTAPVQDNITPGAALESVWLQWFADRGDAMSGEWKHRQHILPLVGIQLIVFYPGQEV